MLFPSMRSLVELDMNSRNLEVLPKKMIPKRIVFNSLNQRKFSNITPRRIMKNISS